MSVTNFRKASAGVTSRTPNQPAPAPKEGRVIPASQLSDFYTSRPPRIQKIIDRARRSLPANQR